MASVHLLDAVSRVDIAGAIVTLPPLSKYSCDHFIGYSPPIRARIANLRQTADRFWWRSRSRTGAQRAIPLASISLDLEWSPAATPVRPRPSPNGYRHQPTRPSSAAPLLFALHPKEEFRMIRDYYQMLPMRPHAVIVNLDVAWAYALSLADDPAQIRPCQL